MTNRREQVLEQLIELAKPLPEYEILLSIPGIAETTATSVIGELGDIRRFTSANPRFIYCNVVTCSIVIV